MGYGLVVMEFKALMPLFLHNLKAPISCAAREACSTGRTTFPGTGQTALLYLEARGGLSKYTYSPYKPYSKAMYPQ